MSAVSTDDRKRLEQLLGYLDADPLNASLIADVASAALDARQPDVARTAIEALEAQQPLPPNLLNLKGLAALAEEQFDVACAAFEALLPLAPADPGLRFNLAWAKAMTGDHRAVVDLIDETVVAAVPRAAALKVNALHNQGDPAAALLWGQQFAESLADDEALMAALCLAATDDEQPELARTYAEKAGNTHEGLSTLGLLALGDHEFAQSATLFDQALEVFPNSARALMGKGLTLMITEQPDKAAPLIDRSAEIFVDHLGTWLAAGWAYFAQGDMTTARQRFEHALALDDTFAESHGALAVLDITAGDIEGARRRADVALRLDRQCLSAALARSLLLTADGKPEAGERVRRIAMNLPVGVGGQSINQAMVKMGLQPPQWPGSKPRT